MPNATKPLPTTTPSVYAYAYRSTTANTPIALVDRDGKPVPLGSVKLRDEWDRYVEAESNRVVLLRRADCGAGCRCAAEYRFPTSTTH